MADLSKIASDGITEWMADKTKKAAVKQAVKHAKIQAVQARSAAVEAANWEDRDGKARPTPERKAKGDWRLIDGQEAGVTVAIDNEATQLDRLRNAGLITPAQCEAGLDFTDLMARTALVSQGRSCLDFTPVGHDGDFESETAIRDAAQRARIYAKCNGPWVWPELRRVCCDQRAVSHLPSLIDGLDLCAKVFGK